VHYGADDNASGVAGLLELARVFGANQQNLRRSLVFVAFSGEELGLLGSAHYVRNSPMPLASTVAMLNMDMIGRLRNDNLTVGGIGTSPQWKTLVEDLNRPRGFSLKLQDDGFGPSDHSSFYSKDIPVLFFFTGTHDEYHKPSDTPDTINVISQRAVVSYVHDIMAAINKQEQRIEFSKAKVEGDRRMMNSTFRVSLGSIPEYAEGVDGVRLSGVRPGSAAEKAGIKAGDIVVELAGKKVKSVQDYTFVLQELEPNKTVPVVVLREGKRLDLQITPAPRQ
jgi:membrane-associated protease RseP (regulator of RpoE activity)